MPIAQVRVPIVLDSEATFPTYQSSGAAGLDLCSAEDFEIRPLERRLVGTGIRIAVPEGYEAQVRPRSGLAHRHGIAMVNAPGTIDADYRGEIRILLINLGAEPVAFRRGDRVGQLVICPVARAELAPVASLEATERGEGGFGSTGV